MSHVTAKDPNNAAEQFSALAITLLTQAAEELFQTYGCNLTSKHENAEPHPEPELALGAAIGFTGEHVRGVLAIAVDEDLAIKLNPIVKSNVQHVQDDWIGELANQLLGRLKNKLLTYNVEVAMSTPVVVRGRKLKIGTIHRPSTRISFVCQANCADVWWDAEVDPALVLSQDEAPDVQAEGEMVLF